MKKYALWLVCITVYCAQSNGMDMPKEPKAQLFWAIETGDNKTAHDLIRAYPWIVNERNEQGYSLLNRALFYQRNPNFEVAQCLVDHGADVNECDSKNLDMTLLHKVSA